MSEIIFVWYNGGKEVHLAGTFNNWSPQPLTKQGNKFFLKLSLPDGYYQYKFVVDGKWVYDLREPSVDDGSGNWNNFLQIGKSTHHAPVESKKEVHHQHQQPQQHQQQHQHPKKEQQPKKEQPKKQQQQPPAAQGQDQPLSKKQQKKLAKQQAKQSTQPEPAHAPEPEPTPEAEPAPAEAEPEAAAEVEPEAATEVEHETAEELEAEPAADEPAAEEAAPTPAPAKKEKTSETIATLEVVGADVDTDMVLLEQFVRSNPPAGLTWEGCSVSDHFFGLKKISIICRVADDVSLEDLCAQFEKNDELVGSANITNFAC